MKTTRSTRHVAKLTTRTALAASLAAITQFACATSGTWVGNANGTNTGNYWDTTQWTGGTVATGTDGIATINNNSTTGSGNTDLTINSNLTLGTLQLSNSSGGNFNIKGSSTTLTFDVTSGTPLLAVNSWFGKVYNLGVGGLTIAGNDGLKVELGSNTIRPQSGLSWTGFSGTLEISSNGGTGGWDPQTAGLMPSVNVSLAQGAGNVDFGMFGGRNQTIGGLDGTVRAFFRNNSTTVASTLTVGANNGSGVFAGSVGKTADGLTTNGGINIIKTGTGTQEFSGIIYTGTAGGVTTVPTVTASGGTLVLSGNNTYNGTTTIDSGATLKIGHVNALGATAAGTTINSGGTLDLNGIALGSGEAITVTGVGVGSNGALVNNGGTAVSLGQILTNSTNFSVGGSGNLTLNGLSSQSGQTLTKVGSGTVTLAGTNAYLTTGGTGSLVVNQGTLVMGFSNTDTSSYVRLSNSATVNGGTLKFDPTVGLVATTSANWGGQLNSQITITSGTLDLNGSSGQNSRLQQFDGTGGIITNSNSTAATLEIAARNGSTYTYSGTIQDGTGTVALNYQTTGTTGSGRINILSGNNSYSGGTTIGHSTLRMGHNNALGTGFVKVGAGSGGTLDLNGYTLANAAINGGNGGTWTNTGTSAATVSTGYNSAGTGGVTISDFTVNGTGDINWSGAIRRTDGFAGTVTKSGTNTLTLGGTGTGYAGMSYTVSGGALAFNMTNGSNFNSGAITSTANVVGAETSGVTNTISSAIGGTGGTFTQSGAGTTILAATNTYTGATTVNAGTLVVNGSTDAASAVSVASGATLGGTGTVAGTVAVTGKIAPGDGGIGTLNTGSVTWNGAATAGVNTNWEFALGAGNSADKLNISGEFTKGTGSVFNFDFLGSTFTGIFTLAQWSGSTTFVAGNFSYSNLGGGHTGSFTINGSNQLQFTAVPEPTSALAGLLLGAGLLRRRRKP